MQSLQYKFKLVLTPVNTHTSTHLFFFFFISSNSMYRSEGLLIPPLWNADPIHCRGCCSPASPGWFWASPSCSVFLCTGEQQSRDALQEEGSLTLQVCGIQPQMSPGLALKPALVGPTVIRRLILQSCIWTLYPVILCDEMPVKDLCRVHINFLLTSATPDCARCWLASGHLREAWKPARLSRVRTERLPV